MYIYVYVKTMSLQTLITTTTTTLVREAIINAQKKHKTTVTDGWTRKDGTNI